MGQTVVTLAGRLDAEVETRAITSSKALTTGSTESLTESSVLAARLELYGYSAATATAAPVNNVADVLVAWETGPTKEVDETGCLLTETLTAGGKLVLEAPLGRKFDLATVFVRGTTNDKVIYRYTV